jgi:hyperosmotically inducible periplasmic protein
MRPRNPAAAMSIVMACAVFLPAACAFAQDTTAPPSISKATIRKTNLMLEHNVRGALYKGKIDGANVRIVAKAGKISLAGTVPDESQVGLAGTIAASVEGVSGVYNLLSVGAPGH